MTRRDTLKMLGGSVGGIVIGSALSGFTSPLPEGPVNNPSEKNSLFDNLPVFPLGEQLEPDQMRITFLGTSCIPRLAQECNSIFVEVGSGDQFIFDCGSGIIAKYNAMGIKMSQMDKIFLTHLHGDHMSDLTHIYCFGPAEDRKSPLYIWGPANSGFTYTDPEGNITGPYDDGTRVFCEKFREVMRWHTESFSFGATSFPGYEIPTKEGWGLPVEPNPVGTDSPDDAYALVPIELDWTKSGVVQDDNVAYYNADTGVKITHFPAIHCRRGSICYKLEWNGMSMIFSGDTKPTYDMISQASGVDVLIHEVVMPADQWASKNSGLHEGDSGWNAVFAYAKQVQNSSHTPQGAFGYLLSQIAVPPRLAVATHFQATDDTIESAMQSIRNHYPAGEVTFASDFMVLNVSPAAITQRRAVVSDFAYYPVSLPRLNVNPPKYWKWNNPDTHDRRVGDPYAQIDVARAVPASNPDTGEIYYDENGY